MINFNKNFRIYIYLPILNFLDCIMLNKYFNKLVKLLSYTLQAMIICKYFNKIFYISIINDLSINIIYCSFLLVILERLKLREKNIIINDNYKKSSIDSKILEKKLGQFTLFIEFINKILMFLIFINCFLTFIDSFFWQIYEKADINNNIHKGSLFRTISNIIFGIEIKGTFLENFNPITGLNNHVDLENLKIKNETKVEVIINEAITPVDVLVKIKGAEIEKMIDASGFRLSVVVETVYNNEPTD
jgi:hypothetical protein